MPKALAALTVLVLAIAPLQTSIAATAKAGDVCKKAGLTSTSNGKKYTCVKSGKKFVWNKGVVVAKPKASPTPTSTPTLAPSPSPSPTPTLTPSPPPTPTIDDNFKKISADLSACKLKESKNFAGAGSKGFPMRSTLPSLGTMKIAIFPVDFSNAVGVGNPGEMFADDLLQIKAWADYFSRGKMQYDPQLVALDWVRAPHSAEWYACVECQKGAKSEKQTQAAGVQELINLVNDTYDFSGVQFIYFVFPAEAESKFGTSLILRSTPFSTKAETKIFSLYGEMAGGFYPTDRTKIWDHLIHEILHYQGLIGHGPINGSDLNIMTNQWGASKAVTSWESFMAGWFGEDELVCIDKNAIVEPTYITLSSLDDYGKDPQSVMVKLSEEELLIIEKRSNGKFTNFDESREYKKLNGFTVYYLNVNKENYRNDMDLGSEEKNFWRYLRDNGSVKLTDGIEFQGVTITPQSNNQIKIFRSS